jgi:hypothetical protein
MDDICIYYIEVRDKVDEEAFNAASPLKMTVTGVMPDSTVFTICSDQSGLVGMIRHLHRQGFVLLSVSRER